MTGLTNSNPCNAASVRGSELPGLWHAGGGLIFTQRGQSGAWKSKRLKGNSGNRHWGKRARSYSERSLSIHNPSQKSTRMQTAGVKEGSCPVNNGLMFCKGTVQKSLFILWQNWQRCFSWKCCSWHLRAALSDSSALWCGRWLRYLIQTVASFKELKEPFKRDCNVCVRK